MKKRGRGGSGLVESIGMGIVLIVIAMALVDLVVIAMANSVNDTAAKNAARAAANETDPGLAYRAALKSLETAMKSATFIRNISLDDLKSDGDVVTVRTKMNISVPVPIPGVGGDFVFMAQDSEAIVGN